MSNHIHEDELIFHKVGDEILSAGFGINSVLLNRGLPPILSFLKGHRGDSSSSSSDSDDEDKVKEDKSVFKSFKNLAVPLGLFTSDKYKQRPHEDEHNKGPISDDLFDKLLNLVDSDAPNEVVAHTTKKKNNKRSSRNTTKSKRKHKK